MLVCKSVITIADNIIHHLSIDLLCRTKVHIVVLLALLPEAAHQSIGIDFDCFMSADR